VQQRKTYPLDQCRLYKVKSPADLAARLGISLGALDALATGTKNYRIKPIERKGKIRMAQVPTPPLQRLHARIHILLSRIETPDYLHSAIKGRSYLSNARAHLNDQNMIKVDVKKFFQSVPKAAVYRFFLEHMKCAGDVAGLLANLLTFNDHLPTGSSSSPIISYYAFKDMFDAINALAQAQDAKMTCYVDDIAISGCRASPRLRYEVQQMIARNGLKSHKCRYFSARRPKVVTGVIIANGQARLPNRRHLLIKQGYDAFQAAATPEEKLDVLKGLLSRVHEAAQIDAPQWLPKAKELQVQQRRLKMELRGNL
jgi:RNA-directed DNA polymerase